MRFVLVLTIVFFVSGCASPFSQSNKTQFSAPTPFQGSTVTMRPKLEAIEPGPGSTAIGTDNIFAIDPKDRSISDALGRWALQNKLVLGWVANYDYPITPAVRGISAPNFNTALNSVRTALRNVNRPLIISISGQTLSVRPGEARPTVALLAGAATTTRQTQLAPAPEAVPSEKVNPAQSELGKPSVSHGKRDIEPSPVSASEKQDSQSPWVINPGDALLSASLARWAVLSKVKITWIAEIDFPVTVKKPRVYAGSLSEAIAAVLKEVSKPGASLTHVLTGDELTIKESGT